MNHTLLFAEPRGSRHVPATEHATAAHVDFWRVALGGLVLRAEPLWLCSKMASHDYMLNTTHYKSAKRSTATVPHCQAGATVVGADSLEPARLQRGTLNSGWLLAIRDSQEPVRLQ